MNDLGLRVSRNFPINDRRQTCLNAEISDVDNRRNSMAQWVGECHIGKMIRLNTPLRIFIADDSPLIRKRVASMLGASEMSIVGQAETPQDSIEGILAAYPDVVVLDVQLEGGTGLQVLRAIRQSAPNIAFVIFSNRSDLCYRKCYLGAGAEGFLDKTHEFDQLVQAVVNASHHAAY
ncbi:MAG: response regulator transcription factor [Polaromonas sp.]